MQHTYKFFFLVHVFIVTQTLIRAFRVSLRAHVILLEGETFRHVLKSLRTCSPAFLLVLTGFLVLMKSIPAACFTAGRLVSSLAFAPRIISHNVQKVRF